MHCSGHGTPGTRLVFGPTVINNVITLLPHGLRFDGPPELKISSEGDGDGTFTLRIGRRVRLGRHVQLELQARGTNVLELGDDAYALDGVRLILRDGAIRCGPKTNLRDFSILKSSGELILGEHVGVSYFVSLQAAVRVVVEDFVSISERSTVVDSEKTPDGSDTFVLSQPLRTAPVVIERNVFVATGCVITMGTRIGRNAVVGANSVLTGGRTYPGGWVIVGAPAKAVKQFPPAAEARSASADAA